MKKIIHALVVSVVFSLSVFAQTAELNIIPQPKSIRNLNDAFEFNHKTKSVAYARTVVRREKLSARAEANCFAKRY